MEANLFNQPAFTPKEIGQQLIIDNNPKASEKYFAFACDWIKSRTTPFTMEDVRVAYEALYEPLPHNLYGSMASKLSDAGLMVCIGSENAKLPKAHGRLIRIWQSAA